MKNLKITFVTLGIFIALSGYFVFSSLNISSGIPNTGAGPGMYESLYWMFGGCSLCFLGVMMVIITILWPTPIFIY